jgi:signal transduction histidine kinase
LLVQMLANLVENALRHTPAGTKVTVSSRSAGAGVELVVRDDGPGVAAGELPKIFRRFYRGERSRTSPGAGLGLALVAAVAELHGARLTAGDAAPGLSVRIAFPPSRDIGKS